MKPRAEEILLPYRTTNRAALRKSVADSMLSAEAHAAKAQEEREAKVAMEKAMRNRLLISEAWEKFPYIKSRPYGSKQEKKLSPGSIDNYYSNWLKFISFMNGKFPDATHMEDITQQHAIAFSAKLEAEGVIGGYHNTVVGIVRSMFKIAGRADP